MKKLRAGIYARISTSDKRQDLETQIYPLREFCRVRGWAVHKIYSDQASGGKEERAGLKELMKDAHHRKIDVALVFRFDRFARSTRQLIDALETFKNLGVEFISHQEAIDSTTPSGRLMFTLVSAFAEFEKEIIRERVRAGLERAKAQGKRLGRPPITQGEIEAIQNHARKGISRRKTARALGIPLSTVQKFSGGVVSDEK